MRDLFEDVFQAEPLDPIEAARRGARAPLRRRVYETVAVAEEADGFGLRLGGRPIKTPARRAFTAPTRALAEAIATEWRAQTDYIDPAKLPLTRLANSIIDGVIDKPGPVMAEIEKYLGSDQLFYRAHHPAGLIARQAQAWDPLIEWAQTQLGVRF